MTTKQVGRYRIQHELGRGGMATVYLAYDPHFERNVALKVLPREFMHEKEFRARFVREAKTIAALEHPAIVPVYDYGEDDGQPFLVMRYMPGGTLTERLQKGLLDMQETADILRRIGFALDQAHSQGIIHRDLKPSNILFDQYGEAYLADFGIVHVSSSTAALTASGSLVGTPAYMSPEQVYGDRELDGRSDIYALGVILFQMLTGGTPFSADTPARMMMKHVMDPVPPVVERRPDLPPDYDEVIVKAMAKDREERFSTATAMCTALSAATDKIKRAELAVAPPTVEPTSMTAEIEEQPQEIQPSSTPQPAMPLPVEEPTKPDSQQSVAKTPIWLWVAVGLVVLACLGGIGGLGWWVSNNGLAFLTGAPTATADAALVSAATETVPPTPAIESSTATAIAAGRLATDTALSEESLTRSVAADMTATAELAEAATTAEEATRDSAIAARETLAAQPRGATATSGSDSRQEPMVSTLFGPERGRLLHETDGFIETANAEVSVRDFVMRASLKNPFATSDDSWDVGIIFRQSDDDQEMRLVLRSDETWSLNNRQGNDDRFVGEGNLSNLLELGEGGTNEITLIAQEDRGFFMLNGRFVSLLDLTTRMDVGDIALGTGFYTSSEQAGASTDYEEFTIWPLENVFGPHSSQLVHAADGSVKTYGAGADLTNFMTDVTFQNPYAISAAGWDIGFAFRRLSGAEEYWLIVDSRQLWALIDWRDGEDILIDEGDAPTLDITDDGSNRLTLIAVDDRGYLLVNDSFTTALDLSTRPHSGEIEVGSTFRVGYEIEGERTPYENFTVWPLP